MTTVKNIYDYINRIAPFNAQEDWDNSGHLIGDFRKSVSKVVMSLDATKEVADFANDVGADMVLTHHPVIFGGLKNVLNDSAVYKYVNYNIAVVSAHTSYDVAIGGINDNLASILGLQNTYHTDDGFTVVGELETPMSIDDFAEVVNNTLDCRGLRYTDTDKMIKKVCVCGGTGSDFISTAKKEADCYVTGELKYHEMLDVSEENFAVIAAGHYETESQAFLMLKNQLEKIFTDVEFIIAPHKNPILAV